jgi:RHS repeat-associated protein
MQSQFKGETPRRLDLSGALNGAGGVGGLLEISYNGTQTTNSFVAYDGNGNVTALLAENGYHGSWAAQNEYGPFGELIRATGPMAKVNPIRFSTKYRDEETDLMYFGYRYYNPSAGRWLNRDSIEGGGINLYSFVANDGVDFFDPYGEIKAVFDKSADSWDTNRRETLGQLLTGIVSYASSKKSDAFALFEKFSKLARDPRSKQCKCDGVYSDLALAFSNMRAVLYRVAQFEHDTFTFHYDPSKKGGDTRAYVYKNDPFRNRDIYMISFDSDLDDTIFHELTHLAHDTTDDEYDDVGTAHGYTRSAYFYEFLQWKTSQLKFGEKAYDVLAPVLTRIHKDPGFLYLNGQCEIDKYVKNEK